MKNTFKPPEPVDGVDFYVEPIHRCTVCIDIEVDVMYETDGEESAKWRAVDGFRDGSLDGDATVMHSEKIGEIEFDFGTDLPFARDAWVKAKLAEMGLNINGDPLRPWERPRPETETTLDDFMTCKDGWMMRIIRFMRTATRLDVRCR